MYCSPCSQGCASVSLADFDPKDVISVRWYNVLSFKFMQPDTNSKKSSSSSENSVRENMGNSVQENTEITYTQTENVRHSESTHLVSLWCTCLKHFLSA